LSRLAPVHIHIWDPGIVDEPDLNRQVLYTPGDIGEPKAECAARCVRLTNPDCIVEAHGERLTPDGFGDHYLVQRETATSQSMPPIVLFDCVDTMSARDGFARIHQEHAVPVFHAAVERWYGQVSTLLPNREGYDTFMPAGWRQTADPPKPILPHVVMMAASVQVGEFLRWLEADDPPLSSTLLHIDGKNSSFRTFGFAGSDS